MSARFADPQENLLQLPLREGMKVADFGAGTGHYAFAAAAAVGEQGRVYAIDVQPEVVAHLKNLARAQRRHNLEALWGDVERAGGTGLRDRSLDAAVVSNLLFQIPHTAGLLAEIRRTLKPGGKVLVIDWAGAYGGMGPAPHLVFSEHQAEQLFIGGGFHKVKSIRAGPHHYGIVFTAPEV
ncbi:MAG TPA: methyltransferase domain-containing protein [Candidatus Paceibacterota bacterium]|nr:methyltransferase domain-containing protein [Candidatus Paceibacterota bacterium]